MPAPAGAGRQGVPGPRHPLPAGIAGAAGRSDDACMDKLPTPDRARQVEAARQAMQALVDLREALLDLNARLEYARLMLRLRSGRLGR